MHIHTYIHIHICAQPAASVFADVYVGVKTHPCNIHTCPCTSAQNTCKVHVTLTAKKCTYIYTNIHMYTHTYAHENTCACMTPSTRWSTDTKTHNLCTNMHTHTHTHVYKRMDVYIYMYVHTCIYICIHMWRLPSPPTLPPPLGRLTSKPALILPFVYGHVVWLKKCISPWFHCPLSGDRRPTLHYTVFWAVGRRPTPSPECGPEAHTLCSPSLSEVR